MDTIMKIHNPYHRETPLARWWHSRSFLQQRLIRLCLSILVMVLCFPLYYLGFFGTVDGPLHPAMRIRRSASRSTQLPASGEA